MIGMTDSIYESILKTRKPVDAHQQYPAKPGIYAFFLSSKADLDDFGQSGQLVYVGIAEKSLWQRDIKQHFEDGRTGSSTLRRSLGAILKDKLRLEAIPRGRVTDRNRFRNYKFTDRGEAALTKWMRENLEIGYWVPDKQLTHQQLRNEEERTTIELKPTLDLDLRTRKYNPLAEKLAKLRTICREEALTSSSL